MKLHKLLLLSLSILLTLQLSGCTETEKYQSYFTISGTFNDYTSSTYTIYRFDTNSTHTYGFTPTGITLLIAQNHLNKGTSYHFDYGTGKLKIAGSSVSTADLLSIRMFDTNETIWSHS